MSIWVGGFKGLLGGVAVVAFSLIGEAGHPKRFAGLFSAAPSVALAGMVVCASFGGLFLAFHALLPASLTLIEKKEGTTKAWADANGGVFAALRLAAFALTAILQLPWNPAAGLVLALVAWAVTL